MGKSKKSSSPYVPRLGKKERRLADLLRAGGHMLYDIKRGYVCHPVDSAAIEVERECAARLLVKKIIKGNGDAMFGKMPQSFVFDPACLR